MLCTTEAVTIVGYGSWDPDNSKMGEFVRIKADGDEETRRYTVSKEINGQRPAEGAKVVVTLHSRMKATAYLDRDGNPRPGSKEAFRAVGFESAA